MTRRVAFVCVRNAGRSQMASAFAERERDRRGLDIEVLSGGTDPADEVHEVVVTAMSEVGFDLSGRSPQAITNARLETCECVATMGCSTLSLDADVAVRDWGIDDPDSASLDAVRDIRDEVERRVNDLFDDLAADAG